MRLSGTRPDGVAWVAYPFPLRPDFVVDLVLPRDLTRQEGDRLSAFIGTLTTPSKPENPESGGQS